MHSKARLKKIENGRVSAYRRRTLQKLLMYAKLGVQIRTTLGFRNRNLKILIHFNSGII